MLAKALSCAVVGLESALVEVEVDLSPGLPHFQIVRRENGGTVTLTFTGQVPVAASPIGPGGAGEALS